MNCGTVSGDMRPSPPGTFHILIHTDGFLVEMFHNYTFKECISVEKLRLWLLILTKTLFLMTILINLTLGNIFIKVKKSSRAAPLDYNYLHLISSGLKFHQMHSARHIIVLPLEFCRICRSYLMGWNNFWRSILIFMKCVKTRYFFTLYPLLQLD